MKDAVEERTVGMKRTSLGLRILIGIGSLMATLVVSVGGDTAKEVVSFVESD